MVQSGFLLEGLIPQGGNYLSLQVLVQHLVTGVNKDPLTVMEYLLH